MLVHVIGAKGIHTKINGNYCKEKQGSSNGKNQCYKHQNKSLFLYYDASISSWKISETRLSTSLFRSDSFLAIVEDNADEPIFIKKYWKVVDSNGSQQYDKNIFVRKVCHQYS